MNVLLRSTVKGLGRNGDVITVSDAYARNFLFPKKLAQPATTAVIAAQKNAQRNADREQEHRQIAVQLLIEQLQQTHIRIRGKANSQGKLFAAIKVDDVQHQLQQQFNMVLPILHMQPDHLKTIGVHQVLLRYAQQEISAMIEIYHG